MPSAEGGEDSFLRSLSWSAFGELFFAGCSLVVLMVLGNFASETALGAYTLGLAIATPAIIFTNLHLRPAYVVEAPGRWEFGHYVALRTLTVPSMLLIVSVVAWFVGYPVSVVSVVLAVALFRAAESISDICLAAPQRSEQMRRIGISRAGRGILFLLGVIIGVFAFQDAGLGIWLGAGATLVLTLVYDLRTLKPYGGFGPLFDSSAMRSLAWRTLPIGLGAGLLNLSASIPAYEIEAAHDLTVLGRFGVLVSIISIGGVVNVVVGNASIPRLGKAARTDRVAFLKLLARLVALVSGAHMCIIAGCYLLGGIYLRMYGASFTSLTDELHIAAWVGLVAGLTNIFSQTVTAMGRFRVQLVVNAIGLVFGIYLALELIPTTPLRGGLIVLASLAAFRGVAYLGVIMLASGPEPRVDEAPRA